MVKRQVKVHIRKSPRWEERCRNLGTNTGKPQYSYASGQSYCEMKRNLMERPQAGHPTYSTIRTGRKLLKEAISLWLSHQKPRIKASSYSTYSIILENHILPILGDLTLEQITPEVVDQFINTKVQKGLSPKYIRDILTILKSILHLMEQQYGDLNPFRFPSMPKAVPPRIYTLSEDERCKLERLAWDSDDLRLQGILLCLYTGLRIGELCALKWCDFSQERDMISISHTMQRIRNTEPSAANRTQIVITTPKSYHSVREIPLPAFLANHCQQLSHNMSPDAYYLTGSVIKFLEPRAYQDFFMRFLRRNHMRPINFHLLRHTFATRCIQCGVDPKSLSEILGHATVEITLNRYVHSSMEIKRNNIELLSFSA